ncbi:MAG TPA: NUDIX domain-containing protein [Candidatus Norongarragalinales archaeon]|nr:NUDIX domain-containing protein [Candidatus Norongarragalinales archaeon]
MEQALAPALRKTISQLKKAKHFVATAYVVDLQGEPKVLLLKHKKLNTWLPPGGHVDENELPDDCVIREVQEETGLKVKIISDAFDVSDEQTETLHTPMIMQLENIDSEHQHIDIIYLCIAVEGEIIQGAHREHAGIKWFTELELKQGDLWNNVREDAFVAIDKARELKERGLF